MKLNQVKIGGKLFQLFVSHPGCGKSIAAASYPPPIYFFDLDKRIDSIAPMFPNRDDIDYDQYGPDEFEKLFTKIQDIKQNGSPYYKTYVLDSLTSLARMAINYSISVRGANAKKVMKGLVEMIQIDDYGAESRILSLVMDAFRGSRFNANFIMTAHLVETNTKVLNEADQVQQRLLTAGKVIAAEIPGYFNEIYLFSKERQGFGGAVAYKMSTVGMAAGINTKTALPLPASIDFTMTPGSDGLYQKIQKACKEKGVEIG